MTWLPPEMPGPGFAQQGFRIQRVDLTAPETSGDIGGVQSGWPRFVGQWTVGATSVADSDAIEVWLDSLRGAQRPFLGRDWRRPFPLCHLSGFSRMTRIDGTPFTGAAIGWSQTIGADGSALLQLTGLPAGLTLSRIDYVGFRWDGAGSPAGYFDRRTIARVTSGAQADASGMVTVGVEPAVPFLVPGGAIAHLDLPCCLMKLTTDTQMADVDRTKKIKGTRISAVQVLRP